MGRLHGGGRVPNTFRLSRFSSVADWFSHCFGKSLKHTHASTHTHKAETNLMLFQLNSIQDACSDTVITSSCYEHRRINKHNEHCQKKTTKPDKLKALSLCTCVCVCAPVQHGYLPCDSLDELEISNTGSSCSFVKIWTHPLWDDPIALESGWLVSSLGGSDLETFCVIVDIKSHILASNELKLVDV